MIAWNTPEQPVAGQLRGWFPSTSRPWPKPWKPATPTPANRTQTWKPNRDPDPEVTAMTLTISDTTMTSDQTPTLPGWRRAASTYGKCPGCPARSWTATAPSPP